MVTHIWAGTILTKLSWIGWPMNSKKMRLSIFAKIELSSSSETEINLPYITAVDGVPKHLVKKLTRAKFEQLADHLFERCLAPCEAALRDAGYEPSKIDEVILVGGSTRIPKVQEIVEKFFGKKPHKGVNPDEVV